MNQLHSTKNGQDITDFSGKTRTYFSAPVSNGWSCVLTVPRSALIIGMHQVLVSYVLVLLAALAVMFFLWRRGRQLRQHLIRVSAMVQALCNSFYAIYWVDVRNGRYEVLKQSHDSRFHLAKQGTYQELLQAFLSDMHEETAREFSDCFSFGAPVPAGPKAGKGLWRRLSAHLERRVYMDQCKRHRGPAPQPWRGSAGLPPGGHRPAAAQPPGERGHGGRRCPPAGPASVLRQHEPRPCAPP